MTKGGGISGLTVSLMTAGALLAYAGLRGVSPLEALRALSTGKLPAVPNRPGSTGAGADTQGIFGNITSGAHPEFVAAAQRYAGDRYSEMLRNATGYSDCSSFVCKAMRDCGVSDAFVAGWPRTTITLKSWSKMHVIPEGEAGAGDLAISDTDGSAAHVVMLTGSGTAIGQQNSRENVQTGPIGNLITVSYKTYRFIGAESFFGTVTKSSSGSSATTAGGLPSIASV